jgi:hypothetical protein
MRLTLLEDAKRRPDLFVWRGVIDSLQLDTWLRSRQLNVPLDLKFFWIQTGGGDLFEGETVLGPFGDSNMADDVDTVNAYHHGRGMPDEYLVFHRGAGGLTAVHQSTGLYVQLNESGYLETGDFPSFESWYMDSIRSEFAPSTASDRLTCSRTDHMTEHPHIRAILESIRDYRARRLGIDGLQHNLSALMSALGGEVPREIRSAIRNTEAQVDSIRFTTSDSEQPSAVDNALGELEAAVRRFL